MSGGRWLTQASPTPSTPPPGREARLPPGPRRAAGHPGRRDPGRCPGDLVRVLPAGRPAADRPGRASHPDRGTRIGGPVVSLRHSRTISHAQEPTPMTISFRAASRWASLAAVAALAVALPATTLAQSPSPAPVASTAPGSASSLDGTWTVDPSIGSFDYAAGDFSGSWVGYRAQEELVGVGGVEAVGRTPDVTGSITLAGTTLTAADADGRPDHAPERPVDARRSAGPPGHPDRPVPDRHVRAHRAHRAGRAACRRGADLRHGGGRPDAPRRHEERVHPPGGGPLGRHHRRGRLADLHLGRLRHGAAQLHARGIARR